MTLGFPTHIKDKATYFPHKIMACLQYTLKLGKKLNDYIITNPFGDVHEYIRDIVAQENAQKLHAIYTDMSDRWKAGIDIYFVAENSTNKRFEFAPVVKCTRVQEIEIFYHCNDPEEKMITVSIDGKEFGIAGNREKGMPFEVFRGDLLTLAKNDGFDSVEDFFAWFSEDFTGKIIHWTDLKY